MLVPFITLHFLTLILFVIVSADKSTDKPSGEWQKRVPRQAHNIVVLSFLI